MTIKGPLTGIRVLDLSQAHAGPFGTQMLGDFGAEIIKIETPGRGDIVRFIPPHLEGEGYYTLALNRNKKSITLDLTTLLGKEAFYDLVKISDVVFDNFRAGSMKKLGADYDTLEKINPKIICCSITGYGTTGPYKDRQSMDDVAQGIAGSMSLCGESNGPPMRPGIPIADISAGIFGAMGIITALYERVQTQKGRKIDLNLLGSTMFLMSNHFQNFFLSGKAPGPQGTKHPILPIGAYQTKDSYIMLGAAWPNIATLIDREWLIDDPRFNTLEGRLGNRKELDEIIEDALKEKDSEYWLEVIQGEGVSSSPINTLDKVVENPQVMHNNTVINMNHPVCGPIKAIANPIQIADCIEGEPEPPPTLGQHTKEVLKEILGYSEQKIDNLLKETEANLEELQKRTKITL